MPYENFQLLHSNQSQLYVHTIYSLTLQKQIYQHVIRWFNSLMQLISVIFPDKRCLQKWVVTTITYQQITKILNMYLHFSLFTINTKLPNNIIK